MKKSMKILAGVMAVCLAFGVGVIPASIAPVVSMTANAEETKKSGTCGENLTWVLDDEGTLTISGTGDMEDYSLFQSPWYYENVKKIIIKDGIKNIGFAAFYGCSNLTSVTIPKSVTNIYSMAFFNCSSLTSVEIPDSVINIGEDAFYGTLWLEKKIKENPLVIVNNILIDGENCSGGIIIPNNVISIAVAAFCGCDNLTSITIPDSVTSIGDGAFAYCSNLESIEIPNSVTSIGFGVFMDCYSLTSVEIPDSVTSIGNTAFMDCDNLTSITIPNSVTSIGDGAFRSCYSLTSVEVPDSVTSIGAGAFYNNQDSAEITILNPDCEIYDEDTTIGYKATIYGYKNSTAQKYAEKYHRKFIALDDDQQEEITATGDINGDGELTISDVVTFQQYLLGDSDSEISDWKQADFTGDGVLDVFDLCLMKKKLVEK